MRVKVLDKFRRLEGSTNLWLLRRLAEQINHGADMDTAANGEIKATILIAASDYLDGLDSKSGWTKGLKFEQYLKKLMDTIK